ncbi:hypothetical protein ANCCEY_09506 [Ancylostoma ceylanicum]|uniref:Uncharacterized protein n=1 Tax=Ancylostoma ceylanicum TaxID=53326 RepID=A0A0D6LH56_9BILA|nr:hypothetical protein ANCCEY_09506 [Ancylostoma ceylanicum]
MFFFYVFAWTFTEAPVLHRGDGTDSKRDRIRNSIVVMITTTVNVLPSHKHSFALSTRKIVKFTGVLIDSCSPQADGENLQALATLWVKLPGSYQDLADATRDYPPGGAYMAYLHSLPQRATSSTSLLR